MTEGIARSVLIAHAAITLFLTGVIWFVQIVHYPLMDRVTANFPAFQNAHANRTTAVVMVPMLAELACGLLLIWAAPARIPAWMIWAGLGLIAVIWLSTFLLQVPQHNILSLGFDADAHGRLVATNWVRTAAWSLRALLAVWMLWLAAESV